MESYAKVVIEFRKAGLVVSCEDIGEEIFIPRSTDSDKSPINKLVDFINNVEDICDPDAVFTITEEGKKWLEKSNEQSNE